MHSIFALLCFVVVIHWLIFPYPSGLLHWHCGNLTIAPVPAKQPWWIWITFPISIRPTSLALWQSNDCPSASKATRMNMDKYFVWINHERLHNHNKAKHNKTVSIFIGIYCNHWDMVRLYKQHTEMLLCYSRSMHYIASSVLIILLLDEWQQNQSCHLS